MKTYRILTLVLFGALSLPIEAAPPSKRTTPVFPAKPAAIAIAEKATPAGCGFMSNPAKANAKYGKWIRCSPDSFKTARCRTLCEK